MAVQRANSFPQRKLCGVACDCSCNALADDFRERSPAFSHDTFDPVILAPATPVSPLCAINELICTRAALMAISLLTFREDKYIHEYAIAIENQRFTRFNLFFQLVGIRKSSSFSYMRTLSIAIYY